VLDALTLELRAACKDAPANEGERADEAALTGRMVLEAGNGTPGESVEMWGRVGSMRKAVMSQQAGT
jgi:hypothetical protein